MRSDIAKVITERPRRRGRGFKQATGYKKRQQRIPLDEQPKGERITAPWEGSWDRKEFTDVLAPLEGFIRKNIGRPWDKVFSEVAQMLPAKGGVSVTHARGHLFNFVDLNVVMVDGVPHVVAPYWSTGLMVSSKLAFVHPVSGLLLLNKRYDNGWVYGRRPKPFKQKGIVVSQNVQFHQAENGVWYELTLASVPQGYIRVSDVWLGDVHWGGKLRLEYGDARLYCVAKRQARKADIKHYGLGRGGPIQHPNIVQSRNRRKKR